MNCFEFELYEPHQNTCIMKFEDLQIDHILCCRNVYYVKYVQIHGSI